MTDSINICLPCGLCCKGILVGFVQLDREEMPIIKQLMDIEEENDDGFFLQPCNKFVDKCTIYSQRPKQCAKYKCRLLKSVEQKELDFDSAIEIINAVKIKRIALEEKIALLRIELQSESFYFRMVELKNMLQQNKSESPLKQNHLELMSDLNQLDKLLSKEFDVSFF